VLQGLTEFLPVSSSGHLVFAKALWNRFAVPGDALSDPLLMSLAFDITVHVGTFLAVAIVFRKDLQELLTVLFNWLRRRDQPAEERRQINYFGLLLVGMIPAALVGAFFESSVEGLFNRVRIVAGAELFTAVILFSTLLSSADGKRLGMKEALIIGLAQILALSPGISRSGITIATALNLGINRQEAARFSFLMALPLILGAAVLAFFDLGQMNLGATEIGLLLVGLIFSFFSGWVALRFLLRTLMGRHFYRFGFYCAFIGLAFLIFY